KCRRHVGYLALDLSDVLDHGPDLALDLSDVADHSPDVDADLRRPGCECLHARVEVRRHAAIVAAVWIAAQRTCGCNRERRPARGLIGRLPLAHGPRSFRRSPS